MALQWVAVDLATGRIIIDLPNLAADSALKRTLGQYESATATLPITKKTPPDWQTATIPGQSALIALDASDPTDPQPPPVWGGMVVQRTRSAGAPVSLALATAEAYCDRRYVGSRTFSGTDQNAIGTELVRAFASSSSGNLLGLPFQFVTEGGAGTHRDRTYADADDRTVYSALQDLMSVDGGAEWTVDWTWADAQHIVPVFHIGTRIGHSAIAGLGPAALFSMPGPVTDVTHVEDYSSGKGANYLIATGGGQPRIASVPAETFLGGRPVFELRWSPSSSITQQATLNDHARRAVAMVRNGSTSVALTARADKAPRLGRDWVLGDDIAYDVTAPQWPDGLAGVARCIAWELDDISVSPILYAAELEGEA